MTTITYIAKPVDYRCKWWQAIIPEDIGVEALTEKVDFTYLKKGADLELPPGTMLIDSEAVHHTKARGFVVQLGFVGSDSVYWINPTMARKMFIKKEGHTALLAGSGDVAAVIRMALYIRLFDDKKAAFDRLIKEG